MTAISTAPPEAASIPRTAVDGRRALQLGLAAVWLLDGVLQYQSVFFTKAFGQLLAGAASGNPAVIASPITWDAHLVEHYPVLLNAVFATTQLLLGLGIAWRPTVRRRARRLDRLVAGGVVARRGPGRRAGHPGQRGGRWPRRGHPLRLAGRAALAARTGPAH